MGLLFGIISVVLIGVIALLALVYFKQESLVYHPTDWIEQTPDDVGLHYEDVYFTADDGVELHGWFVPAENAKKTLLFCHGNAHNISGRLETIQLFNRLGINVFIFDYRGYGKSEGQPSEEGTYSDAKGAWNYLINEQNTSPGDIVIMGRSLGGAIAAQLATQTEPAGIIIESAFTSAVDLAKEVYPFLPAQMLLKHRYPTLSFIQQLDIPKFIAHSRNDEVVPYRFGKRLYNEAPEPKQFLTLRGPHSGGFLETGEEYTEAVRTFFKQL